jgi:hypothetical protein
MVQHTIHKTTTAEHLISLSTISNKHILYPPPIGQCYHSRSYNGLIRILEQQNTLPPSNISCLFVFGSILQFHSTATDLTSSFINQSRYSLPHLPFFLFSPWHPLHLFINPNPIFILIHSSFLFCSDFSSQIQFPRFWNWLVDSENGFDCNKQRERTSKWISGERRQASESKLCHVSTLVDNFWSLD